MKLSSLVQAVAGFLFVIVQISSGSVTDETRPATGSDPEGDLNSCLQDGECVNPDAMNHNQSETASSSSNFCLDDREDCPAYAAHGECEQNPKWMHAHCKLSCNACPANLKFVDIGYGEPQESSGENAAAIDQAIQETQGYMENTVKKRAMYVTVRNDCMNKDKLCSKWAAEGECANNNLWMALNCAPGKFAMR
jgi:ShK domain-like